MPVKLLQTPTAGRRRLLLVLQLVPGLLLLLLSRSASASASAPPPADRIRVVGAWAGPLEVELGAWKVPMLRGEVAWRAGDVEPDRVGLIFGGHVLKDDPAGVSLQQAGLNKLVRIWFGSIFSSMIESRRVFWILRFQMSPNFSEREC